ncbi:MAG: DUF3352 domain-containing protein [Chloroflexota bacterium]|nr:DUF3352 domain-containing protein [Chloroflexota bacterium]
MHRLVIGLTSLLAVAGGAVVGGYLFVSGAGIDRAAELVPAKATVYVSVYLQPSTAQQTKLAGLIGRLPGFEDPASLDTKIGQLVHNTLSGSGLDYETDVRPWIGGKLAVAAWQTAGAASADPPTASALLLAEVKDRPAAEAAIDRLAKSSGTSVRRESYQGVDLFLTDTAGYAFLGDVLVIGQPRSALEAAIDADRGAADALAKSARFRDAMADLPSDRLAAAYVDIGGLAGGAGVTDQAAGFSAAGVALVAEEDGLRLAGRVPFDKAAGSEAATAVFDLSGAAAQLSSWMPKKTLAELSLFGLSQSIHAAEATAGDTPEGKSVRDAFSTIRGVAALGLGLDLDKDLLPLLDGETALAITGFDGTTVSGQVLLRPSDPAAAAATLAKVRDKLKAQGAAIDTQEAAGTTITTVALAPFGSVSYAATDQVVIFGLKAGDVKAALDAHAAGETLGVADMYRKTFDLAGAHGGTELFVDVGALAVLFKDQLGASGDAGALLGQLGTLGMTVPARTDHYEFHAVLTVR